MYQYMNNLSDRIFLHMNLLKSHNNPEKKYLLQVYGWRGSKSWQVASNSRTRSLHYSKPWQNQIYLNHFLEDKKSQEKKKESMIDNPWNPQREDTQLCNKISEQDIKRDSHKVEFMIVLFIYLLFLKGNLGVYTFYSLLISAVLLQTLQNGMVFWVFCVCLSQTFISKKQPKYQGSNYQPCQGCLKFQLIEQRPCELFKLYP